MKVPDFGVAVIVRFPDPPEEIVSAVGLAPNVTPPLELAMHVEVSFTPPEIWLVMLGFPTACTYSV
ncbi:MAG: hypothetical protein DMG79_19250 [Acidobacteria bacterium]|nr:MAG: hypothetical protein DMG79_19250 [Acidobacteriota bacterium]